MMLPVTVVICTRNRSLLLASAIRSLQQQTVPAGSYEILVVDNGSEDGTAGVVEAMASSSPATIRRVRERRIGVSAARNTGWKAARGRIVAYLDDDATANPDWIERLLEAYSWSDEVQGVGGRVEPVLESPVPDWLPAPILRTLSSKGFGNTARAINWPEYLPGGNSSYLRCVFDRLGGFDTRLGRAGRSLRAAEDREFCLRALRAGMTLYYSPGMVISHCVPADSLSTAHILARAYWNSWSEGILERKHFGATHVVRRCAWEIVRSVSRSLKVAYSVGRGRKSEAFWWTSNLSSGMGYISSLASVHRPGLDRASGDTVGEAIPYWLSRRILGEAGVEGAAVVSGRRDVDVHVGRP